MASGILSSDTTWHASLGFDLSLNLTNYKCSHSLRFRSLDAVAFVGLKFWSRGPVPEPFPASQILLTLKHLILLTPEFRFLLKIQLNYVNTLFNALKLSRKVKSFIEQDPGWRRINKWELQSFGVWLMSKH